MDNISKQYIHENITSVLTTDVFFAEALTEKIYSQELQSQLLSKYSTYRSMEYRDKTYRNFDKRFTLRKQILNELFSYKILPDEKGIYLGKGGCRPIISPVPRKFFQIIGLPGSGKSYIANIISATNGAYIIDSDYAKRKFPEFSLNPFASSLLHEEANKITYGRSEDSVFNYCLNCRYSMIMPRIGHNFDGLNSYLMIMNKLGYDIYLIYVDISLNESIICSHKRFNSTGRYTPLVKIKNEYGRLPEKNYHLIKQSDYISGYAWIKTNLHRKYDILENHYLDKVVNAL